jgi:hypothetical protein
MHMFRIVAFALAVMMSATLAGPLDSLDQKHPDAGGSQSRPVRPEAPRVQMKYTVVARLAEKARKTVFGGVSACHTAVRKKADDLYPEMSMQSRGYSPKADVKRFRQRSRFEDAGVVECGRKAIETHSIDAAELRSITAEGVCRQWPPLSGKPAC